MARSLNKSREEPSDNSRTRLLGATIDLVRAQGYAATRVEDICAAAGVTKGSFFHHFASKEELAIAAAGVWDERSSALFAPQAPYQAFDGAVDRLLGYVAYRRELLVGEFCEWSCYAGTTIQEVHETHPRIRDACAVSIEHHLASLRALIDDALEEHPVPGLDSASLAVHFQAVIQGAFVMAKARQDRQAAVDAVDHLYRYVEMLFSRSTTSKKSRR